MIRFNDFKRKIRNSPFSQVISFLMSGVLLAIFISAYINEITDNGKVRWEKTFQVLSFRCLIINIFVIALGLLAFSDIPEVIEKKYEYRQRTKRYLEKESIQSQANELKNKIIQSDINNFEQNDCDKPVEIYSFINEWAMKEFRRGNIRKFEELNNILVKLRKLENS